MIVTVNPVVAAVAEAEELVAIAYWVAVDDDVVVVAV